MPKLSVQIQNRLTGGAKVAAAARAHGPAAAQGLAKTQREPGAPTEEGWRAVFRWAAVTLESEGETLQMADLRLSAERSDDVPVMTARDRALSEVLSVIVPIRAMVGTFLGAEGLKTYGLEGETPRAARATASHCRNVVHLMEQTPASVTTPVGMTFSTQACIASLMAPLEGLEATIGDVNREARELETALSDRDAQVEAWNLTYQGVANTLTGLFQLASMPDIARRVRPSRRVMSGQEEPEVEPAPEPAPEPKAMD